MSFFSKLFGNKQFSPSMSQKSTINIWDILRAGSTGVTKDKGVISAYQAIVYYTSVSAVAKAIDMLSDEMSIIVPYVYDIGAMKFLDKNTDVEDLLNNPCPLLTRNQFLKQITAYYLITGNVYIMAVGGVNKPPVELEILRPELIEPIQSFRDRYPEYYSYNSNQGVYNFKRAIEGNKMRFVEGDGRELLHIKTFNPYDNGLKGLSKLDQIYYEVEQHLNSSVHNLSMLRKGARSSGLITSETELGDEQRPRIREQLNAQYAGSDNAGKIMLLDGGKFDFKEMSTSMKDMDFLNLKKEVTAAVYNIFNIPLPLISTETMTLNNYSEARVAFYDNGVLPLTSCLYEKLTSFLFPRYKMDVNKFKLWYDSGEIPALEPRRTEEINRKKQSGVLTINELRALQGYAEVEGGDVIYQTPMLQPLGTLLPAPTPIFPKKEDTTKEKFAVILRNELDYKGERIYSDEEINDIAEKKGLI